MSEPKYLRDALSGEGACLGAADFDALIEGAGSSRARQHLEQCGRCKTELELLRSFAEARPAASEAVAVKQIEQTLSKRPRWKPEAAAAPSSLWTWMRHGWAVAGLAAMVAVGVWIQRPLTNPAMGDLPDVTRSTQLEIATPLGDLAEAPASLRWRPVDGAARYVVHLEEVDETRIWERSTAESELSVPEGIRKLMLDRKTLHWVIRAENASGKTIAISARGVFRVIRGNR